MKTQHIKCEILKERLSLFFCDLIQLNLYKICFRLVKFVEKIFIRIVMSGMTSQEVCMFAAGKLVNKLYQTFDRVFDLHFRIQTFFGQISSLQRRE